MVLLLKLAQFKKPKAIENTKASKNTRIIEDRLGLGLAAIVNKIKRDPYSYDISLLRRKYDQRANDLIRSAVQNVYLEGINYVNRTHGTSCYLTQIDLDKIKDISYNYTEQFWVRVNKYLLQRNSVLEEKLGFEPRSPLSSSFIVTSLATSLATRVLALATIYKAQQLKDHVIRKNFSSLLSPFRSGAIKKIEQNLPPGLQPTLIPEQPVVNVVMEWVTRMDERVCPECEALDGNTYEIDDSTMPVPPDDTHPNCRCRLMLVEEDSGDLADSGEDFSLDDLGD